MRGTLAVPSPAARTGLLAAALLLAAAPASAQGAPRVERKVKPPPSASAPPPPPEARVPDRGFILLPGKGLGVFTAPDTVGDAFYGLAKRAYFEGRFDEAAKGFREFAERYPRNLSVNEALETMLLIQESRDLDDEPLRIQARAAALRDGGFADSAAAAVSAALDRFPRARLRYQWHFDLAKAAADRGDHAAALMHVLAVADTASQSRLAPYALRLAGDEVLKMGGDPSTALRHYQALLERYPQSPLAPEVRALALELRKQLQL